MAPPDPSPGGRTQFRVPGRQGHHEHELLWSCTLPGGPPVRVPQWAQLKDLARLARLALLQQLKTSY